MTTFEQLKRHLSINWTTVLVGLNGLGAFSPWPDRIDQFSPFLSLDEVFEFAYERLALTSSSEETELIHLLTSLDHSTATRASVRSILVRLSSLECNDVSIEVRKWRIVLLEELMKNLASSALYGLLQLSEFWQGFGFPSDSPHDVQGVQNNLTPDQYYRIDNFEKTIVDHNEWIIAEKASLNYCP